MSDPLLLTKLYIPAVRSNIVLRPRLLERLNEGLSAGNKLTLISAPAGFGKTTLVSEWVVTCGQPVAWLSLDEGDNDLARFLTYLVASLQTIQNDIGKGLLGALQSSQPLTTNNGFLLAPLLNEIAAIPDTFILVLDDYHLVDSETIDHALTFMLDHLPSQMHIVLTTREDPSIPLTRYRVRGQMIELRAADLRFTPEEAGTFLNQIMNLNLAAEDITALEKRTEGWIAGLQLAALSMQGRSDTAGFIRAFTGSHRFVLDYLVEEVLQHQPEQIRSFLLQTAILDRLCASLCNALTEREDGKEMLVNLERSNLFLIPLDDKHQWYRYHHLFSDVLQTHLMETQPDRVAVLHQRASVWYERNGLRSDAIRHALAAKDFESAADLIELAWPAAEAGNILPAAWLSWVKALPEALVNTRPILMVGYAYALLGLGELEAAEARLQGAEKWLEPAEPIKKQPKTSSGEMVVVDQEQWKSLPAAIAVGHAYIAQARGNILYTVRYASQVLQFPEADPFRHSQASMLLGMTYWASGDLEAAGRVFADYTMKLRAAGNIRDAISTTVVLADIRMALGRPREAIRTIEQCLQFVMNQGEPIPFDTADLHRGLSELYLEQGSQEAAVQHLQISKELGEKAELPVWQYRWCIAQARLHETQGDLDRALTLLDEADRLFIRTPLSNLRPIPAMKARIEIAQGRLTQALDWVREQELSPDIDLCFVHEFEHITLVRIRLAQYQNDQLDGSIHEAMRFLDRLLQAAEEGSRMGSVIEILMLQALAHQAQGNILPALLSLERALTLAEPEGYVRLFVDEGEAMRLLIEKQSRKRDNPLSGYVDKLLAVFKQTAATPKPAIIHQKSDMIEPLSERELEVIKMLRSELSGPEIAQQLIVSLHTLRTHTNNIYNKLGVSNRRAAVRRAEELDLF
ncbi:MAG: helix-turn-helix transcriptional regulator [Chloroflexi bacterium HGW-Chloroflexi-10]|nr:MAG: helix-turn-helix transcriptional regulator [Chloroflexi bacterium HGW-Chloroflexi-10]